MAEKTQTLDAAAPLVCIDLDAIREELAAEGRCSANETIPGGRYLSGADGTTLLNCENQLIDDCGKVLNDVPLLRESV